MAFSADGSRIATASSDRTVRVWDSASNVEILQLKGSWQPHPDRGVQPRWRPNCHGGIRPLGAHLGCNDRCATTRTQRSRATGHQSDLEPGRDPHCERLAGWVCRARDQAVEQVVPRRAGCDHYVTKPYSPVQLLRIIRGFLGEKV
jgi:hypothetical protein